MMTDFEIFKAAFPKLNLCESGFSALTEGCCAVRKTGGFGLIKGNIVALIAVAPEHQRQGTGTEIFRECTEIARKNGCKSLALGGGLFSGAVSESAGFFRKIGFETGGEFAEMELSLTDFAVPEIPVSENISFGYFEGDMNELKKAVAEVDEEWVQYFGHEPVFCGFADGKIAGFCIVSDNETCLLSDGRSRIGSIGCVGVVPAFRRNGIGLKMVVLAAKELKKQGCDKVFIHFTHLDRWYGKLGARTFLRFFTVNEIEI